MPDFQIHKNLTKIVFGNYSRGPATAISDPQILPWVQQYKRQVASQLIPVAEHDIGRKIPESTYFASQKIDGEFTALVYWENELFTVNPGGTVRLGLPFMQSVQQQLDSAGMRRVMVAGELYVQMADNRRCRIHDVVSVLRHPENSEALERLRFAIFDWICIDGQPVQQPYRETWDQLSAIFSEDTLAHRIPTQTTHNAKDVAALFRSYVANDAAEGLVVRSDEAGSYKLKPLLTIDAVVIGFTESTDERTGMMHDLLLAVRRGDGAFHVLCRVGGGFTDSQKREMLSDLKDMVVESEYAEVNSDHVAYQMVRPEWVVEITCLDLVAQNTRGRPVNRMVLGWSDREEKYSVIRRMPLVSVISPQFVRIRDDKTAAPHDVRIDQIADVVSLPMADVDATELALPKSKLMQREVYVKQLRGETLVRKFLLWKTNKENDGDNFPAYVAYHCDYSPSRKTPLTREVRVSSSETQIIALWHQLKEENIKKGWERHGDVGEEIDAAIRGDESPDSANEPSTSREAVATPGDDVDENPKPRKTSKQANKKSSAKKTVKKKPNPAKSVKKKAKASSKTKPGKKKKPVKKKKATKKTKAVKKAKTTKTTKKKSSKTSND